MAIKVSERDALIDHIDGPVAIDVAWSPRRATVLALVKRGWLRTGKSRLLCECPHPTHTHLTDPGRFALSKALADWADAIARARLVKDDRLAEAEDPATASAAP